MIGFVLSKLTIINTFVMNKSKNKLIDTTKLLPTPRTSLPPCTLAVITALWAVLQLLRYFRKEEEKGKYSHIALL